MLQANAGTGRVRRRRFITVGLAALAMAVPSVARAGTTSSSSSDQEVHGVVTYPTGLPRNGGAPVRCAANGQGVPGTTATIASVTPGKSFALTADSGTWEADFDIAFYSAGPVCTGTTAATPLPYRNMGGDEYGVVPANATMAVVSLVSDSQKQAFTYREYVPAPVALRNADQQKPTVVAIIEPLVLLDNLQGKANGFSPYHLDFSGAEHPWNRDGNSQNDIDFTADPSPWLPGYPGATPVQITVPTTADQDVSTLAAGPDKDAWASMQASTPGDVHLYRLPGTKIVGAATFSFAPSSLIQLDTPAIYSPQNLEAHGTKTSSVAAGNIHGSCPECVLVLLRGNAAAAMAWATAQPWIDVISNSYGAAGGFPSADQPTRLRMRDAVTGGQTIVWSSGNGAEGNATVPALDYFDDRPGSDWIVTVGGVEPSGEQPDGASRPVDLASYDISYWSAGGTTAGGQTLFGGTSNAAPVVAGTFGETLLLGRSLLGDTAPGHADGVVAQGAPRPCDGGGSTCVLSDGVLTRAELQDTIYTNVYPSPPRYDGVAPAGPVNTALTSAHPLPMRPSYTAQGHGVVHGRLSEARYQAEKRGFLDALRGAGPPAVRPPGERKWMTADSMCRQRLWGNWDFGYFHAGDPAPAFDPAVDAPAAAMWQWCSNAPQDLGQTVGGDDTGL